ncbi:hypothetical protein [Candidatus Amarolinea dominans]|uniref:restriction endonuclease subunit S n=1 Tax=Candidatus Amarolinea dominans TaxID=3140696 RepID=UPI0031CC646D
MQSQGVASQYYVSANGVTRYGLSHDAIKSVLVPVPPPDEQAAIVRYLDYVDRRIRRYIRAKQKLIALLNEQKQGIIHQAVTRGLDPNVRLKPSGVEWLGDVPEHWEIDRKRGSEPTAVAAFYSRPVQGHEVLCCQLYRPTNPTGNLNFEEFHLRLHFHHYLNKALLLTICGQDIRRQMLQGAQAQIALSANTAPA